MNFIVNYFIAHRGWFRDSLHHDLVRSILMSCLLLSIVFSLHIGLMMAFEALSLGDAIWLTFTTATTVGYGDISAASTEGRIATIFLIYVGGIFILAKVVGDYFDYRLSVRDKKTKGFWRWKMKQHIVILNSPSHSGGRYLQRLIKQFRASVNYRDTEIYLLTAEFPMGLPHIISQLDNVVHYTGEASNLKDLNAVCVAQACDVIVLAKDENDEKSDGRSFDILHRLNDLKVSATILVECVEDSNRKRLESAGATIVIRPIRAYPEMIVRAFDVPGSERIIENMFNSENDEYRRYDVVINQMAWSEVVTRLINNDVGIAVAYIDRHSHAMVYNPSAHSKPDIAALITICKDSNKHSVDDVRKLVS